MSRQTWELIALVATFGLGELWWRQLQDDIMRFKAQGNDESAAAATAELVRRRWIARVALYVVVAGIVVVNWGT